MSHNTKLFIAVFVALNLMPLGASAEGVANRSDTLKPDELKVEGSPIFRFGINKDASGNAVVLSGYVFVGCELDVEQVSLPEKGELAFKVIDKDGKCRDGAKKLETDDKIKTCSFKGEKGRCQSLDDLLGAKVRMDLANKPDSTIKIMFEDFPGHFVTADFKGEVIEHKTTATLRKEKVANLKADLKACTEPQNKLDIANKLLALREITQKEVDAIKSEKTDKDLADLKARAGKKDSQLLNDLRYFAAAHPEKANGIMEAYTAVLRKASDEDLPYILADVKEFAMQMDEADAALKVIREIAARVADAENPDPAKLAAAKKILDETKKDLKKGVFTVSKEEKQNLANDLTTVEANYVISLGRAEQLGAFAANYPRLMNNLWADMQRACTEQRRMSGDPACTTAEQTFENANGIPNMIFTELQEKREREAQLRANLSQQINAFGPRRTYQPQFNNPFASSGGSFWGGGQYGQAGMSVPNGVQSFR